MNKTEKIALLTEFKEAFQQLQNERKFTSTLQELESIFFFSDAILKQGFVPASLSRMLCSRIVETFMSWNGYLHGLMIPNPHHMLNITESQMFEEQDKEIITNLMTRIMAHTSTNNLVGITKNTELETQFIDDSLELWKKHVKPGLEMITQKVNESWKKRLKS